MMKPVLNRRIFLSTGAAAVGLSGTADAAAFPDHSLKMVVPFPPGAGTDATARIVALKLGELVHQSIIVDNVAGANGLVGTMNVARAPADGYTMIVAVPGPMTIAQFMFPNMQYDAEKDFIPVIKLNEARIALVVNKQLKVNTLDELVKLIRANPGKYNAGNPTAGSIHHLVAEMFKMQNNLDFTLINYKGGGPALTDLLGGHVDFMFIGISTIVPQVRDGSLIDVMTVGDERSAMLPNVPCSKELGMPGLIGAQWQGIMVPKGTPQSVVAMLHDTIFQALQSPDVKAKLEQMGTEVSTGSSADFAAFLEAERKRWAPVIKQANIKVD
jgi:tripartite-type tricarboxylate transporter receptor subunit TctC